MEDSALVEQAKRVAPVAVVFVASVIAQLFRQTGVRSWQTVWAEDGRVFYGGTHGLGDLVKPHAGYMQLAGRTLGLMAHAVPIDDVAIFYAVAGAVVTSLAALAVWCFAEQLVPSPWLRAVVALQVVLLPVLILEQVANGVNTLWAVTFAGWWALLYQPRRRSQAIAPAIVAGVATLSSVLALTFLPVAAWLAWRRSWPYRAVAATFTAACAIQLLVIVNTTDDTVNGAHHLHDLPGLFAVRVLASLFMGEQWVDDGWKALGWTLGWLAAIAFVAILVIVGRRSRNEPRRLGVVSLGYAGFLYCAVVWVRGTEMMRIPDVYNSIGNRYAALAMWLLVSGIVLLIVGTPSPVLVKWATVTVVAWFALVSVAGFSGRNPRSNGPAWKPSVAAARAQCDRGRQHVELAVVPYPFDVKISCDDLRDS